MLPLSLYQQILRALHGVPALEVEVVAAQGIADLLGGSSLQHRLAIAVLTSNASMEKWVRVP